MDLEGIELPPLMVVNGEPFPICLALLLGAGNSILADCKPRPAKATILLGRVARGPLGDLRLLLGHEIIARGCGHGVLRHVAIRIGGSGIIILAFIFPLATDKECPAVDRCHVKKGMPFYVVGLSLVPSSVPMARHWHGHHC
jgi:hypothetical protein